jgi:hypothetical protein
MFLVQCCAVRYDFRVIYLPPVVCKRAHVALRCLCFFAYRDAQLFVLSYVFMFVLRWPLLFPHKNDVLFVLYPHLFVEGLVSYLYYLCVLRIVVSNTYWLYIWVIWRVSDKRKELLPFISTCVHPRLLVGSVLLIVLVFCVFPLFVFVLCLVYPMLPVSLDCPFLIVLLVFSNVYFKLFLLSYCCLLNKLITLFGNLRRSSCWNRLPTIV